VRCSTSGWGSRGKLGPPPIPWTGVFFLFSDHLGLTRDPVFVDNVVYLLLEDARTRDAQAG
jgi:hypothetical protein